ncbi:voltage-gated potassium channel [Aureococcus anophagefferens]|nr:voltage-gated potassium channel [Aureococcus anophagefferens]
MIVLSTNVGARTYRDKVQQVNEYMRSKSLPAALRDKVKDFYTVQYSEGKMFDEDKILRELSPSLRNEILAYNTRDLFSKVPLLFTAPENFVKAVVPTLTLSVGLEGEKMIHEHTTGDKMYFIYSGVCDITQGQGEHCTTIETIADGCYFGDCAVILGCQRTANVTTKTVSIVYSMSQVGLKSALELAPPDIIKYMKNVAKSRRDRMAHYRKFGRDGLDTSGLILDDQEDTKTEMYRDCLRQKMEIQLEMQEFEELGPDITTLAPPTITQRMSRFTLRSRPSQIGGAPDDRPSTPGGGRRITDFFGGRRQSMAVGNPRVHADDDGGDRPPSGLPNGRYSLTGEGAGGERRTSGTGIGGNVRRRETTVAGSRFKNAAKPPPHIARRARQQANKKSRSSVAVKSVDDVAIFQRTLSQVVHTKKEDAEDEKISPSSPRAADGPATRTARPCTTRGDGAAGPRKRRARRGAHLISPLASG